MGEKSFRIPVRDPDIEKQIAILRNRAEKEKVLLLEDVAVYIAQNVRSNAGALEAALIRLIAHSSLIGTDITLNYAKAVLKRFIGRQARTATVDPFQKMALGQRNTKEAEMTRPAPTTADRRFNVCLPKTREGEEMSLVIQVLEVNIRERERDQLACRDAYERALERRAKTRKRG